MVWSILVSMEKLKKYLKGIYVVATILVLIHYSFLAFTAPIFGSTEVKEPFYNLSVVVVIIIFLQALFSFSKPIFFIKSSLIRKVIKITRLLLPFLIIPFHFVFFIG